MATLRRSLPRRPMLTTSPRTPGVRPLEPQQTTATGSSLLTSRLVLTLWLVPFALYNRRQGGEGSACEDPKRSAGVGRDGSLLPCGSRDAGRLSWPHPTPVSFLAAHNRVDRDRLRTVPNIRS